MKMNRAMMHKRRAVFVGAGTLASALALAAAGCGGGGGSNTQTQTGAQMSGTLADHLTLSVSEDKSSASVGDDVTYQVTLSNQTAAPITSTYAGYGVLGTTLDALAGGYGLFSVKDSHGNMLNTDGGFSGVPPPTPPPQSITFTLQPGQSLPFTAVYRFQPGVYTAAASLRKPDLTTTPAAGPLTVTIH